MGQHSENLQPEAFSQVHRKTILQKLSSEFFDLVIIGGGITGAGTARDAASRGMKVALIESNDFASGTSSRSSKLIHGGIRYLENLEFHLVYEALSERKLLFELAPHLVHPLRFLIPLYEGDRVGMFRMGLGMCLYDILSLFEAPELHERLNSKKTLTTIPFLKSVGLKGSYIYSDAYMDDDRLVIETLRSAHRMGAVTINFVSATGAEFQNEKVQSISVVDQPTGQKFEIRGKHFVSTVGPWTDLFGHALFQKWKNILRPSKGIHITLDKKRFPLQKAVVMAADKDVKRIIFGIPRHDMVIIGTTDTDFKDNPETVHSEEADVDYLLNVVENYFPGAQLTKDDLLASYAGVRPLVYDGSSSESKTSREHMILSDPRNVTFVAGGKYTTYRRMAAQTVESCLENYFSVEDRVRFAKNNTRTALNPMITEQSLQNTQSQIDYIKNHTKYSHEQIEFLVNRHGSEIFQILKYPKCNSVWELEAHFAIDHTMCRNLLDFYLRRVPLFLSLKSHGYEYLENLTNIFSDKLGWNDIERSKQIESVYLHEKFELSWKN